MMMGVWNRLAKVFRRKPAVPPTSVQVTEDGLQIVYKDEILASVRWADVKRIITYKYDLITTDEICVGFPTAADAESWLEISER